MSIDTNEVVGESTVAEAYRLFDDAVLLGSEIAGLHRSDDLEPLDASVGKRYVELVKKARGFQGYECVYSGKGYKPGEDFEGDPVTVYGDLKFGRGVLNAVYIASSSDMRYVEPEAVELPITEDEEDYGVQDSALGELFHEMKAFKDKLQTAPEGLRLFAEFAVKKGFAENEQINGVCMRGNIDVYNILDLSTLELVDIKPPEAFSPVHHFALKTVLADYVDIYRRTLQHKDFRNAPLNIQESVLDESLGNVNRYIRADRFIVMSDAEYVYVPDTANKEEPFEQCVAGESFMGDCLRIDCMESNLIAGGRPVRTRKGNINSFGSLCAVVEIEDATRKSLGVATNIIWIPLFEQLDNLTFIEKSVPLQ